jgi:hypothetical protein
MTSVPARSWRKTTALVVLLGFVPLASGCFGSFNLTRKVYQFNKSISPDKWLRWLMFLALNIMPVYPFATLVDVFFANAWEFWAGSNPVTASLEPQTVVGPNGEVASLVPIENGARIVVTEPNGAVHTATLLREGEGVVAAYDADGRLVGRLVGLASGSPQLVDLAEAR